MARRSRRAALIAALALGSVGAARADGLYLFVIPTSAPPALGATFDGPLRMTAFAEDAAALARVLRAPEPADDAKRLDFTLNEYPQLSAVEGHDDTAASWVIDYQDSAVQKLRSAALQRYGERPTPRQLVEFVGESIDENSNVRGFDVASRVARDRSGDCTEHAVLLTALARSFGLRARVVLGLAIVNDGEHTQAYGHAWSELREGERWSVADAALNEPSLRVRYLPFGALTDEGPGYGLAIAALTPVWVKRLEILGDGSAP